MNAPFLHTMYQQACCNLLNLPKQRVRQWLSTFDSVLFDADGVLWRLQEAIEGSPDVLNAFKAMGKRVFVCTNSSIGSRKSMTKKANQLGMLLTEDEFLSSAAAAARFLHERNFHKQVYVIGEEGIAAELEAVGIRHLPIGKEEFGCATAVDYARALQLEPDVGAIVVGQDEYFNTAKLIKATTYLKDPDCLFVATNRDFGFPVGADSVIPGAGPNVAAVKCCANRPPTTVGKPNPFICRHLIESGVIKPETTLIVGDTLHTDILLGYNCGFQTMLVGSGVTTLEDVRKVQESDDPKKLKFIPDIYLPKLGDLLQFMHFKPCA